MQQLIKDESEPLVCACDVALGVLSRRQDLPVSHNVETLRSHDTSQGCVARMCLVRSSLTLEHRQIHTV